MSFDKNDKEQFLKALLTEMPFGKYKGTKLMDLPGHYLAWFHRQGFPDNKLGQQMALVFELDHNGLLAGLRNRLNVRNMTDSV